MEVHQKPPSSRIRPDIRPASKRVIGAGPEARPETPCSGPDPPLIPVKQTPGGGVASI